MLMDSKYLGYIPEDDIYLFNSGNARKAWLSLGCHYIKELGMHRFMVWAPNAESVTLVGDFNGWDRTAAPMEKIEGGIWVRFEKGLKNGDFYKYCVSGADGTERMKADPCAACSQHGEETASIVYDGVGYRWKDKRYMARRAKRNFMTEPMSIYEMHPGSWRDLPGERPAYRELADELARYCADMGYTHVELMPITEYPYDGSWGYQVTGYYSPTTRYGMPEDFKYFIDTMHAANIGVIIDWVPAHFPKDEHGLAMFDGTRLYECNEKRMAEHPEWGTLIFDFASAQVQSFLISSACLFFEEYHVDGIRVDAVSSMLYLDYGRRAGEFTPNKEGGNINLDAVAFLQKLNSTVLTQYPGALSIAEESTAFPLITAPPDVGGLGFCFKWDMGFMHDTLDYMQMDPYFRSGNHSKLTFSMMYAFAENYVLAYSHDEVVHCKKSMLDKMYGDYEQKFKSLRTLYGYQYAHPGKKLSFMGAEFGQFIEWNYKQQLDWLLLDYPRHRQLQDYCRELNKIYKKYPAMYRVDRSWDGFKWLNVDDCDRSSVAFLRSSEGEESYLICVCNFTPVQYDGFVIGLPHPGTMKEILNSDDERFGGGGTGNPKAIRSHRKGFADLPYSAKLTLPAMSCLYFTFKPSWEQEKKDRELARAKAAEPKKTQAKGTRGAKK